jgi:Spy/CpxP family protein refolding chaperone
MNVSTGPTTRRTRWLAVAVLATTFAAGGLAGAGLAHLHRACRAGDGGFESHRMPPPLADLDLSAEQQQQVRVILDRYHPRLQEAMQTSWPRLKPVFDEMAVELKVFLTPDQRVRFDKRRKEMEERRFGVGAHPEDVPPEGRVP